MKKRVKKVDEFEPVETREEMENCVREICALTIRQDGLMADMDTDLQRVRDRYQIDLAEVEMNLKTELDRAHDWAERHPEEFATKKSVAFVHGTAGFRTGTPKLKTLSGMTWEKVLDVMERLFPEYVRRKNEVDKDKIIADREVLPPNDLKAMGVKVVQDESFYVEPNREPALN
jgi:phage host-nuclease inhibitor protein Gam